MDRECESRENQRKTPGKHPCPPDQVVGVVPDINKHHVHVKDLHQHPTKCRKSKKVKKKSTLVNLRLCRFYSSLKFANNTRNIEYDRKN